MSYWYKILLFSYFPNIPCYILSNHTNVQNSILINIFIGLRIDFASRVIMWRVIRIHLCRKQFSYLINIHARFHSICHGHALTSTNTHSLPLLTWPHPLLPDLNLAVDIKPRPLGPPRVYDDPRAGHPTGVLREPTQSDVWCQEQDGST